MILLCQVFIIQLLSGLCGGFGWLGYSAYTTSKPRTEKPEHPVVYESPVAEVFGYQSYKPSQQVYTTKKPVAQPYQSFFHQGYTTMRPKLSTKKPKQVVSDPLMYPSAASQIIENAGHSEPAAYTRQPAGSTTRRPTSSRGSYETTRTAASTRQPAYATRPTPSRGSYETTRPVASTSQPAYVTTPRPTPSRGSYETTSRPAASTRQHPYVTTPRPTTSRGSYEATTRPAAYTRQPAYVTTTISTTSRGSYETTRPAATTRQPAYVTTPRPTPSRGPYEATTRPAAYTRQPAYVTTTRPTISRGSYEVTTGQVASQYEPVTAVPKPSTHGYETLTGGSTPWIDHNDTMVMSFDSRKFIYVEMAADLDMLPSYWYSSKQGGSDISEDTRQVALQYEPVTQSTQDYETLTSGSNLGIDRSDSTVMPLEANFNNTLLGYWYSAKQDVSDNTEEPEDPFYEVTTRPAASQYEPVTDVPQPPDYETLTGGSTTGTDNSAFDSRIFNSVEMEAEFDILPSYWYSSKQDGSNNTEEPEDDYSSSQTSSRSPGGVAGPLSASGLTGYNPLSSFEDYNPVSSLPGYKPESSLPGYKPESSLPGYNQVSSFPDYMPESSLPGYKPVLASTGYSDVTTRHVAPLYEPVTGVTTPPLTQDYAALTGGMLPNYRYSSAKPMQDDSDNTDEPDDDPSSFQTSSTSPLSLLGLADYKPVLSLGFMERSFPETGNSLPFCHTEEKVEFVDQCEPFKEETCNTRNKEKCSSQVLSNCRPVIKTRVEEVCLNVTNKVCTLVESEERVQEEDVFFISSCSREMEQVCDQSYKVQVTDQEQEVCVDLETVNCIQEKITVLDTVCVEGVEFNCQQDVYMDENVCEKIVKENCTSTPKEVTVTSCQPSSPLCHNLTSQQAVPIMTEVCRDQPTAVCRLVEDVKPVERKVFTYSVSCNMKEQEECKLMEKKKLEASCSDQDRPVCEHHLGEEECVEEDKEFCHKVEKVVEVEVCDDEFQTYEI